MSIGFENNNDCNTYSRFDSKKDGYEVFRDLLVVNFAKNTKNVKKVFTTDGNENLFQVFLSALPRIARNHYNCRSCEKFFVNYGGIVTIDENGNTESAVWSGLLKHKKLPAFFIRAVCDLKDYVESQAVSGVFVSAKTTLGVKELGGWSHFYVEKPECARLNSILESESQIKARVKEEYNLLSRSIDGVYENVLDTAIDWLELGRLPGGHISLEISKWVSNLRKELKASKTLRNYENLLWYYTATAPAGYVHFKNTVLGSLLSDIENNHTFDAIRHRWLKNTDGVTYQRPKETNNGNIERAEVLIDKLGLTESLERCFARKEELELLWNNKGYDYNESAISPDSMSDEASDEGVFNHLRTKKPKPRNIGGPDKRITWSKFHKEVLPRAKKIELLTPYNGDYSAITTQFYPFAKPILQWDNESNRNPFSWYLYAGGSKAKQWNVSPDHYTVVTGITLQPSMWGEGEDTYKHHGKSVFFLLEGAYDTRYMNASTKGNALFASQLKSELHEVRRTIESYSQNAKLHGVADANACGLRVSNKSNLDVNLKVTTESGVYRYKIDRWD